ncbi:MAG: M20/M25/M40 family metallo-hydrolase [Clostridia bacterium]|nr:M20/M25/M40 family metallo-hydrolase [Clostridia bacterium]
MKKRTLLPESARCNASSAQNAAYAATLKRMVDCKTVWTKTAENAAEYQRFYEVVAGSFPLLHTKAERLTFGDGCFFYILRGENANKNILLMSHHDVVDGGDGWESDPFDAVEKDGYLFGRGTIDTKTPLFAQLQAAEELLAGGYSFPGINLYIGSSHNEEVGGDGMVLAVEYFREKGIRFDMVVDEGGAITSGMIPGVSAKSAMVAVHEKSRHHFRCSAKQNDVGHTGLTPNDDSMVGRMADFISEVNRTKIYRGQFHPEVRATFERHAPYMSFPLNVLFGNLTLFSPIIKKIMLGIPQTKAMLSTACTFTTVFAGDADQPAFRAKTAQANLSLRCVREDDLYAGLEKIRQIGKKYGVEIEEVERDYCRPTDFNAEPFRLLESVLHENFPDVIVAPFLLTAGTDARRFSEVADSILRFAPIDLNKAQFASIHNKNEHIAIENIGQCVLFYKKLIEKTCNA